MPTGYLAGLLAIPAFAAFGLADMMWHTVLGIETTIDILFSPSHLGLDRDDAAHHHDTAALGVERPRRRRRPSLGRLLPALIGLAFAAALVSLFLSYGDAMQYRPRRIVQAFSMAQDSGVPRAPARPVAWAPNGWPSRWSSPTS